MNLYLNTPNFKCNGKYINSYLISKRVNNGSSLSRSHQNFSNQRSKTELAAGDIDSVNPVFSVGPLSSFTQESLDVIKVAASQIEYSKDLRSKSTALIKDCLDYSKKNTKVVDEVFQKKIAETLALSVSFEIVTIK